MALSISAGAIALSAGATGAFFLLAGGLDRADKISSVLSLFTAVLFGILGAWQSWPRLETGRADGSQVAPSALTSVEPRLAGSPESGDDMGRKQATGAGVVSVKPLLPQLYVDAPAIFGLPGRLRSFVGRNRILNRMEVALSRGESRLPAITVVHGLGGVGKSQLAIEFAWRHFHRYRFIGWLDAEVATLLAEKIAAMGPSLGVSLCDNVERDASAVLSHLRNFGDWLIIFDNATSYDDIRSWLPQGVGHVLITTRSTSWNAIAETIFIDVLGRAESIRMLSKRVSEIKRATADALSAELGDLPLALAQAAAYLEHSGVAADAYLTRLRRHREWVLTAGQDYVYSARLDSVWLVTLERLKVTAPATSVLMQVIAFTSPEPLPIKVLAGDSEILRTVLTSGSSEERELQIDDALGVGISYSLCRRNESTVQMHRVLQSAIRLGMSSDERKQISECLVNLLICAVGNDPDEPTSWPSWALLGPHLLYALESADLDRHQDLAKRISTYAWHLFARGDYAAAQKVYARLCEQLSLQLGEDNRLTLRILANHLSTGGDGENPKEVFAKKFDYAERCRRIFGPDDPATLHAENMVLGSRVAAGKLAGIDESGRDLLSRCERLAGKTDHLTLAVAGNLAYALSELGEHDAALDLARLTTTNMRSESKNNRDSIWAAKLLVYVLLNKGDLEEAERWRVNTLERARQALGSDHPYTIELTEIAAPPKRP